MRPWLTLVLLAATAVGGVLALMAVFNAGDRPGLRVDDGPVQSFADQCAKHTRPPTGYAYNSRPPTSGPHRPALLPRDRKLTSDDELLHALELGNVVIAYADARPPRTLLALQEEIAGTYDVELAAAGQSVVLGRRRDVDGIVALAWRQRLAVGSPRDPVLRAFIEQSLGRGARGSDAAGCR